MDVPFQPLQRYWKWETAKNLGQQCRGHGVAQTNLYLNSFNFVLFLPFPHQRGPTVTRIVNYMSKWYVFHEKEYLSTTRWCHSITHKRCSETRLILQCMINLRYRFKVIMSFGLRVIMLESGFSLNLFGV